MSHSNIPGVYARARAVSLWTCWAWGGVGMWVYRGAEQRGERRGAQGRVL